jgi:hypothetical protein
VRKKFISAVEGVQFVSYRMAYMLLRGRWCYVIFLNIHDLTDVKIYYVKCCFYEELERVFDKFPKYHKKSLLTDFHAKVGSEDIFKQMEKRFTRS